MHIESPVSSTQFLDNGTKKLMKRSKFDSLKILLGWRRPKKGPKIRVFSGFRPPNLAESSVSSIQFFDHCTGKRYTYSEFDK